MERDWMRSIYANSMLDACDSRKYRPLKHGKEVEKNTATQKTTTSLVLLTLTSLRQHEIDE
jgi:hypothetical protein